MIDTLMMAYTVETVNVEKVMACTHQYSSCNSEEERPYDTEDAVTTWINKVWYCFSVAVKGFNPLIILIPMSRIVSAYAYKMQVTVCLTEKNHFSIKN